MFENGFTCFHCRVKYTSKPSEHTCADGTTFEQRTGRINEDRRKREENERADRSLTDEDRKFLQNLKVKW